MNSLDQVLKTQAALQKAAPQLKKLNQACTDMEAAFMKNLVTSMRKGAGEVHFGQSLGGEVYQDMFDQALSEMLASQQGASMAKTMAGPLTAQVMNQTMAQQKAESMKVSEENK